MSLLSGWFNPRWAVTALSQPLLVALAHGVLEVLEAVALDTLRTLTGSCRMMHEGPFSTALHTLPAGYQLGTAWQTIWAKGGDVLGTTLDYAPQNSGAWVVGEGKQLKSMSRLMPWPLILLPDISGRCPVIAHLCI